MRVLGPRWIIVAAVPVVQSTGERLGVRDLGERGGRAAVHAAHVVDDKPPRRREQQVPML